MKSVRKKGRRIVRALANLTVIAVTVCLPSLHYARVHLHYFYGVIIVHWHPINGLSPEHHDKKAPVAEHNHALSDLFNLWTIGKHQGNPNDIYQPQIFLSVSYESFKPEFLAPETTALCSPSGRSPPAVAA
jgi:hypothetical protein